MTLYSYFMPTNKIPDPRGSLLSGISPEAIYLANDKLEYTLKEYAVSKYPPELRAEIRRYTVVHKIVPPRFINKEQTGDIYLKVWLTTTPSSSIAIAYLSLPLLLPLLQ